MTDDTTDDAPKFTWPGTTMDPPPPPTPQEVESRLQKRRESLELARATRAANSAAKSAKLREAAERRSQPRTAADARVGVSAHPEAAERRQEPTREQYRPEAVEQLTRRKRHESTVGALEIPKHLKKPGWDYQWLPIRVLNEPVDPSRLRNFREGGWRPVMAKDMPDMAEYDANPDSPIEAEACRLYLRPMTLTREAQAEDLEYALQQQRDRTMAAASGASAIRGESGIPNEKGIRRVPVDIVIEGLAG